MSGGMSDWRGNDPWRLCTDAYGTYWHNIETGETERPKASYVRGDLPEYISPVTGKPVDGRAARREDLARSGCVEVDPPKRSRGFVNERFAKKHGAQVDPEAVASRKRPQRIDPRTL